MVAISDFHDFKMILIWTKQNYVYTTNSGFALKLFHFSVSLFYDYLLADFSTDASTLKLLHFQICRKLSNVAHCSLCLSMFSFYKGK